jgi:hypothetical protein
VGAEQAAGSGVLVQQMAQGHCDGLGLVSAGQAVGGGLDQGDDFGAVDGDDGWHGGLHHYGHNDMMIWDGLQPAALLLAPADAPGNTGGDSGDTAA